MPFYTTCPKTDMPFYTIALKQTWLFADMTFYTTAQLQFSPFKYERKRDNVLIADVQTDEVYGWENC